MRSCELEKKDEEKKKGKSRCPECAGELKYDSSVRRYVCTRCGLALNTFELDKMRQQQRDSIRQEKGRDFEEKKRKREYLDWWLSEKE